jgi:mono/diheme cytochrome c family protein
MSFRGSFLMIIVCALVTCACSNQPTTTTNTETKASPATTATATPDEFADVRGIFAKECQNCHTADGTGGKVKLEDGKTLKVPSFRAGHALRHTDSDFRRQIMEGGDGMPAFKDKLTPQQIDELLRFVRQEFQPGHTPPAEKSGT